MDLAIIFFTAKVAEVYAKDAKHIWAEINVTYTSRYFALYSIAVFAVKLLYFNLFRFYRKGRRDFREGR